jgi:hypothetical protein
MVSSFTKKSSIIAFIASCSARREAVVRSRLSAVLRFRSLRLLSGTVSGSTSLTTLSLSKGTVEPSGQVRRINSSLPSSSWENSNGWAEMTFGEQSKSKGKKEKRKISKPKKKTLGTGRINSSFR